MTASPKTPLVAEAPDVNGNLNDPDSLNFVAEKLRMLDAILTSASDPVAAADLAAPVWQLLRSNVAQLAAFTRPWAHHQADTSAAINCH